MWTLHVRPLLVNDHFSYATATTFLDDNFTILQLAIDCIFKIKVIYYKRPLSAWFDLYVR